MDRRWVNPHVKKTSVRLVDGQEEGRTGMHVEVKWCSSVKESTTRARATCCAGYVENDCFVTHWES